MAMFYFDPMYFVFALPALLLALIAQWRVKAAINKYSRIRTGRGETGAGIARAILDSYGLSNVRVERTGGFLGDHYDPLSRTLRLSAQVYDTPSVAAAGIAAHETGHALQQAEGYWPMHLRSAMVPVVQFGSYLGPIIFMLGWWLSITPLAWAGVYLFGGVALFSLVTLPVEFDASRRAKELLVSRGYVWGDEAVGVARVLDAAALTYVAALAQSLSTLLYYVFLLTGFRRRR
jgi:Zn-dependent membrane protease YugP